MRYLALATDYDGTLATKGQVDPLTLGALDRCRASGRHIILVTGRELEDLARVCPFLDRFSRIVAENGALLYEPASRRERLLASPAPQALVERLRARGVAPLSVGRVIVATREPHETVVLEAIRDLGLEHEVIFNKGAVMVLPSGINKATGMRAALRELELSAHNVVAVGDAENDHAFLSAAECGVAVANALPALRERADLVTRADHGAGVAELVGRLLADDLRSLDEAITRHDVAVGTRLDGAAVCVRPARDRVLIAGPSGSGKSSLATALVERVVAQGYQTCVIDPEGDYDGAFDAVTVGGPTQPPAMDEVRALLERGTTSCVVNLLAVPAEDRARLAAHLWPLFAELRTRLGRPHWILVDEAHHVLPAEEQGPGQGILAELEGVGFVTVLPRAVAARVVRAVDVVIGVGPAAAEPIREVAAAVGEPLGDEEVGAPSDPGGGSERRRGQAARIWRRAGGLGARGEWFLPAEPQEAHRRHVRKYAAGRLDAGNAFFFRGPTGALSLQARNLDSFVGLAEGVDDATWEHHLHQGDYARWFRDVIGDDALAEIADEAANDRALSARASRARIRRAIERRYTKPAAADAEAPASPASPA